MRASAGQLRRWSLFGREPNAWAAGGTENFPEGHIIGRDERFIVGTTGRQVGKTDELADAIDRAMSSDASENDRRPDLPPSIGVLGPTYEKAELSVMRYVENLTKVFGTDAYNWNQNKHQLVIRDPLAGKVNASLHWMSAEEAMNVVGLTYSWVGIDESQEIPDSVWYKLLPTLDVRDAHALILGTPDVRVDQTWFQGLWEAGQDPLDTNTYSFTIASWDAPWMNIERIEAAKKTLPPNEYRRLYGGEWVEEAGLVFTGYEASLLPAAPIWDGKRRLVAAVDLAIQNDFNVFMVGDPMTRTALYYERWNLTDPIVTYDRILELWERFGRPKTWVDATGMGAIPARELGRHMGPGSVVPVVWSAGQNAEGNKMHSVRALAGDLQHRKTMFPATWDDVLREMKSFIYGRTPSGLLKAEARSGAHDDTVMSLVMLNKAFNTSRGNSTSVRRNYLETAVA